MQQKISCNLEMAVTLMKFHQDNMQTTERLLIEKYAIPNTDISLINHKIFEKLSTYCNTLHFKSTMVLWNTFHKLAAQEANVLKQQMSKNFGLSEKGFSEMCSALRQGNEELFEQVFLHHFKDCIHYLMNNYNLNHEDAYDASMDTLIQFRKKLIDGKIRYGNVRFLFTKMASQVYIKSKNKLKRVDGLTYDAESNINEEELVVLEKAIEDLGEECQDLLKLNFYEKMTIAEIATLKDRNAATLRKTKQRCLFKLKNLFAKHNY